MSSLMKEKEIPADNQVENVDVEVQDVENELPTAYWLSFRFIGTIVAFALLGNALLFGLSMPFNVVSVINQDIGPSPNYYLISLAFTLVSGVILLVIGRTSDIFGRRPFLIGAQILSLIGAIICATAKNINTVVGGSVLIGLGAGVQTNYPLLIQELVPNKHRAWAQGGIMIAVFPAIGWGPAIARSFVEHTKLGWRWCYWLDAIVCAVSIVLLIFCYFPPGFDELNSYENQVQALKRLDYGGFFLYASGLVLVLLAFVWGEGTYPWNSAHILAPFVVGVVLLVAFGFYEVYMPLSEPLLPMSLLKIRPYVVMVIMGTVGQMAYYALSALLPTQITALYSTENITIGLMSSTTGAALAAGEAIAAPFFKSVGRIKWQLVFAATGMCAFIGGMAASTQYTKDLAISFSILGGIFIGWIELVTIVIAGLVVPPHEIGVAQSFYASTRAVGGTIATSIYLTVYKNRLTGFLTRDITRVATQAGLPSSEIPTLLVAVNSGAQSSIASVPGMTAQLQQAIATAVQDATSSSFRVTYLCSLSFGGVALIAAFFATDVDKYLTGFVNKQLKQGKEKAADSSSSEDKV